MWWFLYFRSYKTAMFSGSVSLLNTLRSDACSMSQTLTFPPSQPLTTSVSETYKIKQCTDITKQLNVSSLESMLNKCNSKNTSLKTEKGSVSLKKVNVILTSTVCTTCRWRKVLRHLPVAKFHTTKSQTGFISSVKTHTQCQSFYFLFK